jgi:hypothetical protein
MSIRSHWGASLFLLLCLFGLSALPVESQSEQVVEVVIKDFTFVTKQEVLRLGLPTVIKIVNKDNERHDFGSTMFEGLQARIEKDGVIVYGRGLGGVMLDPKRDATDSVQHETTRSAHVSLFDPSKHEGGAVTAEYRSRLKCCWPWSVRKARMHWTMHASE